MRGLAAAAYLLALAGCTSLSPDARFSAVQEGVKQRTGAHATLVRNDQDANSVRSRVKELLAKPLGPQEQSRSRC